MTALLRPPPPITVKLTRFEHDVLYNVASDAAQDNRAEPGRSRAALERALDKMAAARRASDGQAT